MKRNIPWPDRFLTGFAAGILFAIAAYCAWNTPEARAQTGSATTQPRT